MTSARDGSGSPFQVTGTRSFGTLEVNCELESFSLITSFKTSLKLVLLSIIRTTYGSDISRLNIGCCWDSSTIWSRRTIQVVRQAWNKAEEISAHEVAVASLEVLDEPALFEVDASFSLWNMHTHQGNFQQLLSTLVQVDDASLNEKPPKLCFIWFHLKCQQW